MGDCEQRIRWFDVIFKRINLGGVQMWEQRLPWGAIAIILATAGKGAMLVELAVWRRDWILGAFGW